MVFKQLCVLVLWRKVALALEWLSLWDVYGKFPLLEDPRLDWNITATKYILCIYICR